MSLTRRQFLTRVAAAGSVSLAYEAMTGLGLLAAPAQQTPFELSGRVSGVRVVILGGGLAGMTAAYELGKVGYDCRVLEARARPAAACSPCAAARSAKRTARARPPPSMTASTSTRGRCGFRTTTTRRSVLPRVAGAHGSLRARL